MNECLLTLCLTLFSGFGDNYGAEVSNSALYMRVQAVGEAVTITQGVKLSKGGLSTSVGFGSYYQDNTNGLMFYETDVQYTLSNGLYAKAYKVDDKTGLSIGLSIKF